MWYLCFLFKVTFYNHQLLCLLNKKPVNLACAQLPNVNVNIKSKCKARQGST